jgi:uncharacterized protein with PQ loop repeat
MIGDILTTLFGDSYAWQDIVIAVVSILFGFILIPQLRDVWRGKSTLNLFTASLTTIGLYILAATFYTMQFWISFTAEIFSGTIWLLLFALSFKNKRKGK